MMANHQFYPRYGFVRGPNFNHLGPISFHPTYCRAFFPGRWVTTFRPVVQPMGPVQPLRPMQSMGPVRPVQPLQPMQLPTPTLNYKQAYSSSSEENEEKVSCGEVLQRIVKNKVEADALRDALNPPPPPVPLEAEHDPENLRFTVHHGEQMGVLDYELPRPGVMDFYCTAVPRLYRGSEIGPTLAKAAFEYVAENNLKMKLTCPFLEKILKENPVYQEEYTPYID